MSENELRFVDAVRLSLDAALRKDASVCLLGEDITVGGPFGATKGLAELYGRDRIRDTPISEGAVMGLAIGAALAGRRPVVELMFVDFITLAMDQLVNHAAKLRYMSGGQLKVPLTVRVQGGAVGGYGAHHSQSLEAWFVHVPGLKVVAPSTPADARGLLSAAIEDDDPVVFFEHRGLYWTRAPVPEGGLNEPLGRALIRRRGSDLTIVAWSRMVGTALGAARSLVTDGIEAEVIDLRTLSPLDLDTIMRSVRRTGRLLVASEEVAQAGVGAEVVALVASEIGPGLRGPIGRIGAPFIPPPSGHLEALFVPTEEAVASEARRVVGAGGPLAE